MFFIQSILYKRFYCISCIHSEGMGVSVTTDLLLYPIISSMNISFISIYPPLLCYPTALVLELHTSFHEGLNEGYQQHH